MIKGQGENKEIMSMDYPMVVVEGVGKACAKWLLASSPYYTGGMKREGEV